MLRWLLLALRWLIGVAQIKAVIATVLTVLLSFAVSELSPLLAGFLSSSSLIAAFSGLHPSIWYFLNLLNIAYGVPVVIGAYISRFLIRRIPFIG
ncbi:hypothetical protein [Methylovorus mays]|uniref:hypothetical protein n=1 Tax=Methylovorus mays TaxID=184077 RepID=UPI001E2C7A14|nr:hypothetical protein [Methylovorus mays]MCB5206531.1 hypothetical protein [Methylovorus mays]